MAKILIDGGHGGKDNGGGSNSSFLEKDMNLKMSKYMRNKFLEKYEVEVFMTREDDIYLSTAQRGQMALKLDVDLFISNHINSFTSDAKGSEIVYSILYDNKLANKVLDALVNEGAYRRRTFTKESTVTKGRNWYGVLRNSEPIEGIIIEYGFASNPDDTKKILADWQKYVEAVVGVIAEHLGLDEKQEGTKLIGDMEVNIAQMKQWATSKGASQKFIDSAELYYEYGKLTGLRGDLLYCQSAKETNFGKYTGAVKESMNNFAGIKIKNPTGDKTNDHESFATADDGVRAHFNHISAYVGLEPIGTPHNRFYVVKSLSWAGTIKYVEQLGGKYAPNPDYGFSIVRDYFTKLAETNVETIPYEAMYHRVLQENKDLREQLLALTTSNKSLKDKMRQIFSLSNIGGM